MANTKSVIAKTSLELKLIDLAEQAMIPQGFQVVDLDCHLATQSLVRIYVDRIGGGGVSVQDCAHVSRLLNPVIGICEELKSGFELEVSSPGLDRRLSQLEDFKGHVGEEVRLHLVEKLSGLGAQPRGVLVGASEKGLDVNVSGNVVHIAFNNIRKANSIWAGGSNGI